MNSLVGYAHEASIVFGILVGLACVVAGLWSGSYYIGVMRIIRDNKVKPADYAVATVVIFFVAVNLLREIGNTLTCVFGVPVAGP